jgi:hypothetical protein
MKDLKLWLSISNLRNVPNSLLLYSRIADYAEDLFQISEDEDEYEVLRRVRFSKLKFTILFRLKARSTSLKR